MIVSRATRVPTNTRNNGCHLFEEKKQWHFTMYERTELETQKKGWKVDTDNVLEIWRTQVALTQPYRQNSRQPNILREPLRLHETATDNCLVVWRFETRTLLVGLRWPQRVHCVCNNLVPRTMWSQIICTLSMLQSLRQRPGSKASSLLAEMLSMLRILYLECMFTFAHVLRTTHFNVAAQ